MTPVAARGTLVIPEAAPANAPTALDACDTAVAELTKEADAWFSTPAGDLVPLLDRLIDDVLVHSREWIGAALSAKRIPPDSAVVGEEWTAGVLPTARYLRLLRRSLTDIARGRRPKLPGSAQSSIDGRTTVPVLPVDAFDKVSMQGFSARVWLRSGVTAEAAIDRQAGAWFGRGEPGVSLVLGAGNVASIPAMDALDRLFIARHVVVLKMNPVNDYLGPIFAKVFGELVRRGVLRIVYGGAEVGTHLVNHPDVSDVHVTGSDKTYEAIVFGGGSQGAARKAAGTPLVTKRVTGELGNVSPVIVVPGPWSAKDLTFHGENIASMLANNGGFNCIAARVVVTHSGWQQRSALLDSVRAALRQAPQRYPYYPGAEDRFRTFVSAHPEAERYGDESPGCVPWTLVSGLQPDAADEICFTTESFNGVFAETGIDAADPVEFVRAAVRFCNDRVWGTLGASIIVHPKSLKDPGMAHAVEQAIADLRYGTVTLNHWSALGFTLGSAPWGAYPGHTIDDIQSGIGTVHNSFMLDEDDIDKTVIRGPFRMPFKPPWFVTHRNAAEANRRFALLSARPSWRKVPGLVLAAMRG